MYFHERSNVNSRLEEVSLPLGPGVWDREPNLQGKIWPDNTYLISSFKHGQECLNKPVKLFIQQREFYKILHNFDPNTSKIGPIPPVSTTLRTGLYHDNVFSQVEYLSSLNNFKWIECKYYTAHMDIFMLKI